MGPLKHHLKIWFEGKKDDNRKSIVEAQMNIFIIEIIKLGEKMTGKTIKDMAVPARQGQVLSQSRVILI